LTDLSQIDESTLAVEGIGAAAGTIPSQVTCDPVNTTVEPKTRTCHVNACQQDPLLQDIGPVACANRNPDGTVDLTVTGKLSTGTPILGEQNKKTTGQCS
jgi:hypothetical protein